MYKVGYRDLVNNQKDSNWKQLICKFSSVLTKNLLEKTFTKDSEKWLNNQRINLMN